MPTLSEIRRDVCPAAEIVSPLEAQPGTEGVARADPEVGWVRLLRPRVPGFDALELGDLAILPEAVLAALRAAGAEPAGLIAQLMARGVAAIVLVGDGAPDDGARAAIAVAQAVALPALRLVGADAAALERSVIGFLVNRRAEVDRQAGQLEARVGHAALQGQGLEALCGVIATFLGRAVAVEGLRGERLALHAPDGIDGAAAAAARYLSRPREAALRVPLPGAGSLALLGTGTVSELERAAADRVAGVLALQISRDSALRRARETARRGETLPAAGPPWVVLVARQVPSGEDVSVDEREALRDGVRRLFPAARAHLRGDALSLELRMVVAPGEGDPLGLDAASRVADGLSRLVAVSRPFGEVERRPEAEAEARATLEAAEAVPRELLGMPAEGRGVVVRAERLPVYRLFSTLHNLPGGHRHAEALLTPLLDARAAERQERLLTLRALLDQPSAAAAAQALGVHRNTLLYRARRIEELTGWRLDDPDLRFALALAIRLVHIEQENGT